VLSRSAHRDVARRDHARECLKIAGAGLISFASEMSEFAITTIDAFSDGRYAMSVL
jgi:hypothetical protein